jgi:hypothetical protein
LAIRSFGLPASAGYSWGHLIIEGICRRLLDRLILSPLSTTSRNELLGELKRQIKRTDIIVNPGGPLHVETMASHSRPEVQFSFSISCWEKPKSSKPFATLDGRRDPKPSTTDA